MIMDLDFHIFEFVLFFKFVSEDEFLFQNRNHRTTS